MGVTRIVRITLVSAQFRERFPVKEEEKGGLVSISSRGTGRGRDSNGGHVSATPNPYRRC